MNVFISYRHSPTFLFWDEKFHHQKKFVEDILSHETMMWRRWENMKGKGERKKFLQMMKYKNIINNNISSASACVFTWRDLERKHSYESSNSGSSMSQTSPSVTSFKLFLKNFVFFIDSFANIMSLL